MPGPYAHLTLLYELLQPARLKSIFSPASGFEAALRRYAPYCMLGGVSPDYPNLATGPGAAPPWADAMHVTRAGAMIPCGIRRVSGSRGAVRDKQLAWLLGYCAHAAADLTIHPVVEAKVGAYAANRRQHRVCEMNQDSYIYRRMKLGEIGASDYFTLIVTQCSPCGDRTPLDRDIAALWEELLAEVYPELFMTNPPDWANWQRGFHAMGAGNGVRAVRLFPLAGVIAASLGLAYPAFEDVDRQYIDDQLVPLEKPVLMQYDEIYERAAVNAIKLWRRVEQALCRDVPGHWPEGGTWNLDSGRDEHDRLVFWE